MKWKKKKQTENKQEMKEKKIPTLKVGTHKKSVIALWAVLPVLDDGRIIMVRQYRNALERETIEIPAGCRDFVGEDTRECFLLHS